ncbi:hypothetical protein NPIL_408211 [Nephila pilipes]|uniref:Uncharacterized protein n=1 Tax=Nephila pilipes TaxID=299642 RepID=A0A8X6NP11_NEPPI|nr:hypothetical protein NPIL_408211 [Nephila pilipes]
MQAMLLKRKSYALAASIESPWGTGPTLRYVCSHLVESKFSLTTDSRLTIYRRQAEIRYMFEPKESDIVVKTVDGLVSRAFCYPVLLRSEKLIFVNTLNLMLWRSKILEELMRIA